MFNNTKKTIYRQSIILSTLLMFSGAASIEAASSKQTIKEGNLLYEQGDYVASQKKYQEALEKDTESDIINFNLGTALYKEGEYEEAVDHFQKVFLSEEDQLRQRAYYNSGNALYKLGITEEHKGSAALAIPPVELSIKHYERALEINEEDEDTKHNYEFVQKELKRLQEVQQQQQQQGDQGQESGESGDQDQQSQDNQSQEGQEDQQQQGQQQQGDQQENQQGQQGQEEDKEQNSDQQSAQEGEEDKDKNQQNTSAQPQSASELTPEEAQMLLDGYQQKEEPQQLLNMQPKINYSTPVLKDW